jgi:hypothetical protein
VDHQSQAPSSPPSTPSSPANTSLTFPGFKNTGGRKEDRCLTDRENELYHPPGAMKAFLVVSSQNEILNPVLAIRSAIVFMWRDTHPLTFSESHSNPECFWHQIVGVLLIAGNLSDNWPHLLLCPDSQMGLSKRYDTLKTYFKNKHPMPVNVISEITFKTN